MTFPLLGWWGWEGDIRIMTYLGMDPRRADFHGRLLVQYILDCAGWGFKYFTKRKKLQFLLLSHSKSLEDKRHFSPGSEQTEFVCVCLCISVVYYCSWMEKTILW